MRLAEEVPRGLSQSEPAIRSGVEETRRIGNGTAVSHIGGSAGDSP